MKTKNLLISCLFLLVLSSCTAYKKVPYLQGWEDVPELTLKTNKAGVTVLFQPDDVLSITVNAGREPIIASAFNLPLQPSPTTYEGTETTAIGGGYGRQTYMVDKNGQIDFPILGMITVSGMNREALETYLKKELQQFMKETPVITIRLMNYRISVMGEVTNPGQYTVPKERVTILEALAMAGDMTIYGRRDNVILMREIENDQVKAIRLDLTNVELLSSPYYYLQQNDVIYVEPNKARSQSSQISTQTTLWVSIASILLGVANIIITVVK